MPSHFPGCNITKVPTYSESAEFADKCSSNIILGYLSLDSESRTSERPMTLFFSKIDIHD